MGHPEYMDKRTIAVFDFDGTLTTKDTLIEFIKYACGKRRLYGGFLLFSPLLVLMKLHLYPNGKAKEKVFSHFFKGWEYSRFKETGRRFAEEIEKMRNEPVIQKMNQHLRQAGRVYVVSASILEWVQPWCEAVGIDGVVATEIEVDADGVVTGRFSTPNCYGQEKVNRFLQVEPDRKSYVLYAYGDSSGDKEMIALADVGTYC